MQSEIMTKKFSQRYLLCENLMAITGKAVVGEVFTSFNISMG